MDSGNEHPIIELNRHIRSIINTGKIKTNPSLVFRRNPDEQLANKFLENAERFRLKSDEHLRAYRKHIAPLNEHFAMIENDGGGKNDCLIISFLMGVSSAYRSVGERDRNSIADFFRRRILPHMLEKSRDPNVLATLGGNTVALIRELTSTSYLSDIHITLLGHLFQVSILSLETGKAGRMGGIDMLEPPTLALLPAINKGFNKQYVRGIIICNRGNGHYETVTDTDDKTILFPVSDLEKLFNFMRKDFPFNSDRVEEGEHRDRLGGIEIKEGDIIEYDGKLCVVIERKVNGVETWEEGNLGRNIEGRRITRNNIGKPKGPASLRGAWITPFLAPKPKDWNESFLLDSSGTSRLKNRADKEPVGYQKLEKPGEPQRVKAVIFVEAEAIQKVPVDKIMTILDADMADRKGHAIDTSIPGIVYLKPASSEIRKTDMEIYNSALEGSAEADGKGGSRRKRKMSHRKKRKLVRSSTRRYR